VRLVVQGGHAPPPLRISLLDIQYGP
jgi:hypothetical protein